MIHEREKVILLAGYASELVDVVPVVAPSADLILVNEEASWSDVPKAAEVVVFVLSAGACYSTRLRGLFMYVYDRVSAPRKYVLAIDDVDLSKFVFPEIAHLPRIALDDLRNLVDHSNL
jgi:hypothetical protein